MRRPLAATLLGLVALVAVHAPAPAQDPTWSNEIADHVDDLRDRDQYVRDRARRALVGLGQDAVPALVELLGHETAAMRAQAARTIGMIGSSAVSALPALVAASDDRDPAVRKLAELAVKRIRRARLESPGPNNPWREEDLPSLMDALQSKDASMRALAAAALGLLTQEPGRVVPALASTLADPDARVRLAGARALGNFVDDVDGVLPPLLKGLGDPSVPVRVAAYESATGFGPVIVELLLLELEKLQKLRRDDRDVRPWLGGLLWELGPRAVNPALWFLEKQGLDRRAAAAEALGYMVREDPTVVRALRNHVIDDRARVRRLAATSIGRQGRFGGSAAPALEALLRDVRLASRLEAAEALGAILVDGALESTGRDTSSAPVRGAIDAGLDWLAAYQHVEGYWDVDAFARPGEEPDCTGFGAPDYDLGVTGLVLTAFLKSGATGRTWDPRKKYAATVGSGLRYLLSVQNPDGSFPDTGEHRVYNHAGATLALLTAWRHTRNPVYEKPALRAMRVLLPRQQPGKGWRYEPGESDTSVTGWVVVLLREAELAGFDVPRTAYLGAAAWLDEMTDPETGRTGYQARGEAVARKTEFLKKFPPQMSEALTATAIRARLAIGQDPESDVIRKGVALLLAQPPAWNPEAGKGDMYYWYHGAYALQQVGGLLWRTWRIPLRKAILPNQRRGIGPEEGSWDPIGPWGSEGGRVYSTALMVLTLEAYAGFEPRINPENLRRPPLQGIVSALAAVAGDAEESDVRVKDACLRALYAVRAWE